MLNNFFEHITKVFKIIFSLLCVMQLIYLVTLLVVYKENISLLELQMQLNTQLSVIKLRDLMTEYIQIKITKLGNDILPILTILDQLSKEDSIDTYYSDYTAGYINKTCVYPSNDVPFTPIFTNDLWWDQNKTELDQRLYGMGWFGKDIYIYNQLNNKNQ